MSGLELRQELRLTQQLVMTPQLQMSIKLLQVTQLELVDIIQRELSENPVLEESTDDDGRPDEERLARGKEAKGSDGDESSEKPDAGSSDGDQQSEPERDVADGGSDDVDWEGYLENHANQAPMPSIRRDVAELPDFEATFSRGTTLFEHVLWQIRMTRFVEEERQLALSIIGNLDGDGYLSDDVPLAELAAEAGLHLEDAEEVLLMVQDFDPVGIGARDLRECLLAQVRGLGLDADVRAVVDRHLDALERYDLRTIARDLGITLDEVHDVAKIIATLEPYPGRAYSGTEDSYITPDVYVHRIGDEYFVVVNDDGMPRLKISGYYRSAFSGDRKARDYIKGKLRSAQWMIRSIDQRRRTIVRVTECIVEKQRAFFDDGIDHLKPMILRDVADALGLHESTVSRVTNGKYMHSPRGIFELKYFFNAGIRRTRGRHIANESVKQTIRRIVDKEDKKRPLSDQKIVDVLATLDIVIARRTVAKYRELLGVLPSSRRRQRF